MKQSATGDFYCHDSSAISGKSIAAPSAEKSAINEELSREDRGNRGASSANRFELLARQGSDARNSSERHFILIE